MNEEMIITALKAGHVELFRKLAPDGVTFEGDVDLRGCIRLSQIPVSMFSGSNSVIVDLTDCGLSETTVATINTRQNTPGYNGPSFRLSIRDTSWASETTTTAADLPAMISTLRLNPKEPVWVFAKTQATGGNCLKKIINL